ncbi:MAG: hypothetical protein ACLU0O_00955 [Collinsella sp.]
MIASKDVGVTFKDVAGQEEAKESPQGGRRLSGEAAALRGDRRQAAARCSPCWPSGYR